MVEDDIFGPFFQCFGREIVAVKFFTGERHKDAPGAHLAAVGGHKVDGCLIGKAPPGPPFKRTLALILSIAVLLIYPQVIVTMVPRWTLLPGGLALALDQTVGIAFHRAIQARCRQHLAGKLSTLAADIRHLGVAAS